MKDVSKPQGLSRRGNVWQYRRRVPLDLVECLGKSQLKESLHTQDLSEAKVLRNRVAAKFDAMFEAARQNFTTIPLPRPSGQTQEQALKAIRDYVTTEDAKRAEMFKSTDWANDPEGTADAKHEALDLVQHYKDPSSIVTAQAISIAAREIFGSDPAAAETLNDWDILRRAILELENRGLARMRGDYGHTAFDHLFASSASEAIHPNRPTSAITLSAVIDQYRAEYTKTKSVGPKRVEKITAALELILRFFDGDTPVSQISRKRCREFRDLLNELPTNLRKHFPDQTISLERITSEATTQKIKLLARETQDVYFNSLKRLLKWAKDEAHIERNPADELFPLREKSLAKDARLPFATEQLNLIFNAPLYRGCKNDKSGFAIRGPNVIRGTRFWVPLLGLFTGMRLNEICQLDVADIRKSNGGIFLISLNTDSSGKSLKTKHSKREIPVHPELIKSGFLNFVHDQDRKAKKLFSDLKASPRGYHSERISRWFNEGLLPKVGAKTTKTSFHSFRHNFRDALREINAPAAVVQGLAGWEMEAGVSANYGSGLSVDQLAPWIERIRYPSLDLSYLHLPDSRQSPT